MFSLVWQKNAEVIKIDVSVIISNIFPKKSSISKKSWPISTRRRLTSRRFAGESEDVSYRRSCHRCCSEMLEVVGRSCRCSSTWASRSGCWSERCGFEVGVAAPRGRSHWPLLWKYNNLHQSVLAIWITQSFIVKGVIESRSNTTTAPHTHTWSITNN